MLHCRISARSTVLALASRNAVNGSRCITAGGFMHFMFAFAFVAVFISTLTLGFALNPDNREELNRGLEMLRKVGGTQLSYIH
jgi:hypothetical protein